MSVLVLIVYMILSVLWELAAIGVLVLLGMGIALQPGAVLAGHYVRGMERNRSFRWRAWLIVSIAVYVVMALILASRDWSISTGLNNFSSFMIVGDYSFIQSLWWLLLAGSVGAVLQLSQLLGLTHGERDLQFYYEQIKGHKVAPTWCERYMEKEPWSLQRALVEIVYLLWAPRWSLWPYGVWLLVVLFTSHDGFIITGPLLIVAVISGYLMGHYRFHDGESRIEGLWSWLRRGTPWLVVIHLVLKMVDILLAM